MDLLQKDWVGWMYCTEKDWVSWMEVKVECLDGLDCILECLNGLDWILECLDGLDWILECLDGLDWILKWLNGMVLNISKLPPITPRRNQTDIILTADIKSANPRIYNNSVSANLPNHIQIIAS